MGSFANEMNPGNMKKLYRNALIVSLSFVSGWASAQMDSTRFTYAQEKHLVNLRQLTFGGDNAEAYFSFDGKWIIFQKTNPKEGIACDQIFIGKVPTNENEKIQSCIATCDGLNIKVRILPNLSEYTTSSIYINNIGLLPVVNVGDLPLDKKENRILKRSFDIIFSLLFFLKKCGFTILLIFIYFNIISYH